MITMQFLTGLTTAGIFTVCAQPLLLPFRLTLLFYLLLLKTSTDFVTWPSQTTATLLTDLNRDRSATAQGACSLVRCLGAAAGIAAMQPLADAAGLGWCFAVYAVALLLELPLVWVLRRSGAKWRRRRTSTENEN